MNKRKFGQANHDKSAREAAKGGTNRHRTGPKQPPPNPNSNTSKRKAAQAARKAQREAEAAASPAAPPTAPPTVAPSQPTAVEPQPSDVPPDNVSGIGSEHEAEAPIEISSSPIETSSSPPRKARRTTSPEELGEPINVSTHPHEFAPDGKKPPFNIENLTLDMDDEGNPIGCWHLNTISKEVFLYLYIFYADRRLRNELGFKANSVNEAPHRYDQEDPEGLGCVEKDTPPRMTITLNCPCKCGRTQSTIVQRRVFYHALEAQNTFNPELLASIIFRMDEFGRTIEYSHLCGNSDCVNPEHGTMEPKSKNIGRIAHHNGRECCDCEVPCLKNPGHIKLLDRFDSHIGWGNPKPGQEVLSRGRTKGYWSGRKNCNIYFDTYDELLAHDCVGNCRWSDLQ
ncbi:MAG: hypothetical protein Q9227_002646 [Pyrenula ochraceoflavens]